MTTSGTNQFSVSRDDIIRQGLLNIGKLDPDMTPGSRMTADCSIILNMMSKQWMGKADFAPGLKVWTRKRGHMWLSPMTGQYLLGPGCLTGWTNNYVSTTLTVVASTAAVTLAAASSAVVGYQIGIYQTDGSLFWTTIATAPGGGAVTLTAPLPVGAVIGAIAVVYQTIASIPLVLESAVLRDITSVDTPLRILRTTQDYDNLPNKAQPTYTGDPTSVFLETQLVNANLFTDVGGAADVTKHIVLTYMEPVQDFNNPTDTPYFPPEWYLALCWGLSKLICPMYNRVWTELMQSNFDMALTTARHKDAELTTLYFQPGAED